MSEVQVAETPEYNISSTEHNNESVEIKPGSVGLGVFATVEFETGEWVGDMDGQIIEDPNYESDCCIYLEEDLSLEPIAPFRFLNHSCQPNCRLCYSPAEDDEPMTLWIETTEPVTPGMELTIDYSWPAEAAVPCQCGCPECRGWIVAEDQMDLIIDQETSLLEEEEVDYCLEPLDDLDD